MNRAEFEERSSSASLADLLGRNAQSDKGISFISGNGTNKVTYAQLYNDALTTGGIIYHLLEGNSKEVIIQLKSPERLIKVFWSCLLKGVLPVPLSIAEDEEGRIKLLNVLKTLSGKTIIYDSLDLTKLATTAASIGIEDLIAEIRFIQFDSLTEPVKEKDERLLRLGRNAFIQYSSGSSGNPKGVLLSHQNLIANVSDIFARSHMSTDSKLLSWMPLTHDMGLIGFHLTGVFGNLDQFVMPTELFIKRPLTWLDNIDRHRVTHSYSPNFGYRYLLAALPKTDLSWDLSSLQLLYNGAEPISVQLCDEFELTLSKFGLSRDVIYPAYGLAEASVAVCLHAGGKRLQYNISRESLKIGQPIVFDENGLSVVSTGPPMGACSVRITSDSDQVLPDYHLGHIEIKGANVTSGYYNNPEETGFLFTKDKWLRTGDLGFKKGGELIVTGRLKNLIIINGQNYFPADLEKILFSIPELEMGKVAVTSIREDDDEKLIVVLSVKIRSDLRDSLTHTIRQLLLESANVLVHDVYYIKKIPKTTSGKIQYYKLRQQYSTRSGQPKKQSDVPAELSVESLVNDLQAFFKTRLDSEKPLTTFGLNSINALPIVFTINRKYRAQLSLGDFFANNSIQSLFEFLVSSSKTISSIASVPESAIYDTSVSQKRLWILRYLNPLDKSNIGLKFSIKGSVTDSSIIDAWKKIIRKHEIFRTSFKEIDGNLFQEIHAYEEDKIPLTKIDFSMTGDPSSEINHFLETIVSQPIEVLDGLTWKLFIIKIADGCYCSFLFCHHIVLDGWSTLVLKNELLAGLKGQTLSDLSFQHKDYAHWQNNQLSSGGFDEHQKYWRTKFVGGIPKFTFPALKESEPGENVQVLRADFSLDTVTRLKKLCEDSAATLFAGLCSVVGVLLCRYSPDGRAFFGIPSSGRGLQDLEHQVGYYLNVLPVEVSVDEFRSFRALLINTMKDFISIFQHQDYPIEYIISGERNLKRTASSVFDVLVLLENFETLELNSTNDISIAIEEVENDSLPANLYFEFKIKADGLSLHLKYNSGIYDARQMSELVNCFSVLLTNCTLRPDSIVHDLQPTECYERPDGGIDNDEVQEALVDIISGYAKTHPFNIAVISDGKKLSYADLDLKSSGMAFALTRMGIVTGDVVMLFLERSELAIISIFAAWKVGAIIIPVDSSTPVLRIKEVACDAAAVAVITNILDQTEIPVKCINPLDILQPDGKRDEFPQWQAVALSNVPAYAIYTSGSGGRPKSVLVTHTQLMHVTRAWIDCYKLNTFDVRLLQLASFGFDVFIGDLCRAFACGGTLILCPSEFRALPEQLYDLLKTTRVNIFESTPSVVLPLLDYILKNREDVSFLTTVIIGSDKWLLSEYNKHRLALPDHIRLINSYGTTETTIDSTFFESDKPISGPFTYVPIGKPLKNSSCFVLDEHHRTVPMGVAGNLFIGGPSVAEGYLNDPILTARRFFVDEKFGRLYNTGDLVRRLPSGDLEFLKRADSQIKILGNRVEPMEVERTIKDIGNIKSVAVTLKNVKGSDYLCAYIVPAGDLDVDAVRSFVAARMPRFMVPTYFVLLDKFPLTINGKVDVRSLPDPKFEVRQVADEALNENEVLVARIWSEILGVKNIYRDDDFFHLGGHSLKAIQVLFRVNKQFRSNITLSAFFNNPVLKSFCKLAVPSQAVSGNALVAMKTFPLSSNQKSVYLHTKISGLRSLYNLPRAFRVSGEIDLPRMQEVVNTLISRHEILRTVFVNSASGLSQSVLDTYPGFKIDELNVDSEESLQETIDELIRCEFDFSQFPLFKITVITHRKSTYILFVLNHIISDALSSDILFQEMKFCYNGNTTEIKPLTKQYRDFVFKQADMQLSFPLSESFLNTVSKKISALRLVRGHQSPFTLSAYEAGHHILPIQNELINNIKTVCTGQNATPFALWSSAVAIVLYAYTRQSNILLAYPVTQRDLLEEENSVGFFANMQAVLLSISDNDSFIEVMKKAKKSLEENLDTRYFSFDEIADRLPSGGKVPRIEASLVLNEVDSHSTIDLKDCSLLAVDVRTPFSKYDLTIEISRVASNWSIDIEYKKNLFEDRFIVEFANRLIGLAMSMVSDLTQSVGKVSFVDNQDEVAYAALNNTTVSAFTGLSTSRLIFDSLTRYADRPAIECEDRTVSYGQLDVLSGKLASVLLNLDNLNRGDVVALYMKRSENLVAAIFAIIKSGMVFLPIDRAVPLDRVEFILTDSNARLVISDEPLAIPSVMSVPIGRLLERAEEIELRNNFSGHESNDIIYILYTSGSTGSPKGVEILSQSLANYLLWFNHYYMSGASGFTTCLFTSLGFDLTMSSLFSPFLRGDLLIVFPDENPIVSLRRIFNSSRINAIKITPSHIKLISEIGLINTQLKKIVVGGEIFNEHASMLLFHAAPMADIYNEYGPTETTIGSTVMQVTQPSESTMIGRPIANTKIYILGSDGKMLPVETEGQIAIGGIGLANGYRGNSNLTATKFILNKSTSERIYLTGDLGMLGADGVLRFYGRDDDQIKHNGFRIEPAEIEKALMGVPGIVDAFVAVRDYRGDALLIAYLMTKDHVSVSEIRVTLNKKLPVWMVPTHFIKVESFSVNLNGKMKIDDLPIGDQYFINDGLSLDGIETTLETRLLQFWRDVLNNPAIANNTNFFSVGGNSIRAVQLFNRLDNEFPGLVDVTDIYNYPTATAMAQHLGTKAKTDLSEGSTINEFIV